MDSAKDEHHEEHDAFLVASQSGDEDLLPSRESELRKPRQYLRLMLECAMALTILGLLIFPPPFASRIEGRRSPVPRFPRRTYTFVPNNRYLHEDMFENNHTTLSTLHNWIELSAAARGYIQVPDRTSYDLGEPYTVAVTRHEEGPGYMMSVFHQLHCLSYLVEHFQQGYGGLELTKEVAHHAAHCFDYIRQALMCAADTSLEGLTKAGPGWGSEHVCKDYDAVLKWANEHGAMPWRNELLPEDSTL
ncbi:hypothetical protein B0H63DRAFT_457892 [Podospora didyma]|uniref:Oxidase ustYa n=1 Tax=Podospora didyma TaxID=330526 RepID=A0AAE0U7C7_9PEZI|nr:hypothetical protein B0H63DRAFT_457892 [Podospora didyma]